MSWPEVLKTTTVTAVFIQSIATLSQDERKDSSNYYINVRDPKINFLLRVIHPILVLAV